MGTAKQVDQLLWAVAEAHRLRNEQEERAAAWLSRSEVNTADEAFVTEWQPADVARPLSHSGR